MSSYEERVTRVLDTARIQCDSEIKSLLVQILVLELERAYGEGKEEASKPKLDLSE